MEDKWVLIVYKQARRAAGFCVRANCGGYGGGAGFKVIYFSIYCVTRPQYGDFNIFISDNKAKHRPTSAELKKNIHMSLAHYAEWSLKTQATACSRIMLHKL